MTTMQVFHETIPNAENVAAEKFRACPWQFFDGVPDHFPDMLVWGDLAITRVMNSGIHQGIIPDLDKLDVRQALASVPDLDMATDAEIPYEDVRLLFLAMRSHRIGMSRIAKVLCRKRPHLVPMLDSVVTGFLRDAAHSWSTGQREGKPAWFDTAWAAWTDANDPTFYMRMAREALHEARTTVEQIRSHLASVPETGVPADAPLLRIWEATLFWHLWSPSGSS